MKVVGHVENFSFSVEILSNGDEICHSLEDYGTKAAKIRSVAAESLNRPLQGTQLSDGGSEFGAESASHHDGGIIGDPGRVNRIGNPNFEKLKREEYSVKFVRNVSTEMIKKNLALSPRSEKAGPGRSDAFN